MSVKHNVFFVKNPKITGFGLLSRRLQAILNISCVWRV